MQWFVTKLHIKGDNQNYRPTWWLLFYLWKRRGIAEMSEQSRVTVLFPCFETVPFSSSEESKAISRRPDSSSHKQSNTGSARRSARPCTRTGWRPITAQRSVPGQRRCVWPWEASWSAASKERRLLRRYLLRVPQGAGCPHAGARRLFALPAQPGSRGVEGKLRLLKLSFTSVDLGCTQRRDWYRILPSGHMWDFSVTEMDRLQRSRQKRKTGIFYY